MPKFKHIREKSFFASHPLYDVMNDICNPTGEGCGVTVKQDHGVGSEVNPESWTQLKGSLHSSDLFSN